ncbi:hypothetical protein AA0Z99_00480 [Agrococcus sp. 1P02AA]|uniref:hypothetical protein n=1 Tax=Agrococcus sp. 1P02AA TaxID=3132259 RepID=UPI0039A41FC0
MSTAMPEFEMPQFETPPGAAAAARPAARAERPAPMAAAEDAEPVQSRSARRAPAAVDEEAPRPLGSSGSRWSPRSLRPPVQPTLRRPSAHPARHFGWRQLLVAGIVGTLLGIALPTAMRALDDAGATAQSERLRGVALDYLTAIATGRAGVATALAPVTSRGRIAPDAVLASAEPITDFSVQLVEVAGASGSVDVRFRVGGTDVLRSLEAALVEGEWRLRDSLAEVVDVRFREPIGRVEVAGVPLDGRSPVLLYPGSYTIDAHSGAFLLSGGDRFVVDGDARTPTVPYVTAGVVPRVRDYATELALDVVADCQQRSRCPVALGLRLLPVGEPYPVAADAAAGVVELMVSITAVGADPGVQAEWFDVRLRAILDERGVPIEWRCGEPGEPEALRSCTL